MTETRWLDALLGDPAAFGAGALLRRAAIDRPQRLASVRILGDLLDRRVLRAGEITLSRDGATADPAGFTAPTRLTRSLCVDSVDPLRTRMQVNQGKTLLVYGADRHLPLAYEVTAALREHFLASIEAAVFLTPAGQQGFAVHYDPVDAFVVQTEGTKHWTLWPVASAEDRAARRLPAEDDEPLLDVVLEPGDVLQVPRYAPHLVRSRDTVSVHMTFSVRPETWRHYVALAVDVLLEQHDDFAGLAALADGRPGTPEFESLLRKKTDLLAECLSGGPAASPPFYRALRNLAARGGVAARSSSV